MLHRSSTLRPAAGSGNKPFPEGGCQSDAGFSLIEIVGVMFVIITLSAMTAPLVGNMLAYARLSGDAKAVSNSVAVAKMRASSAFSRARLAVNVTARTFQVDVWRKTGTPGWQLEGETHSLSSGVTFGYGSAATPPANTQGTIGQAPKCRTDAGVEIDNTACIEFNSRGLPVDSTGTPTGVDAMYLTDGTMVYGVTVGATGVMRFWRTPAGTTPDWSQQ